jgi:death-on-curing family protein
MARRRKTVKQLANEANLDIDEALVALWDADFEEITSPSDTFGTQELNRARRALGLATRRELKNINYWTNLLKIDESELRGLLYKRAVRLPEKSRRLERKGISRLKAEARKRGIDPVTGNRTPLDTRAKTSKTSVFRWRTPGHKRELHWLNESQVRAIHFALVEDFSSTPDPIVPPGVQSESLLASAVFRPMTALGGTLKYPTIETSAAALLHSLIQDHPFLNGNKRTALVSTLVFLDENGFFPDFDEDEIFKLVLHVAQHKIADFHAQDLADREVLAVADWFCRHCRIAEKGNRPIPFRKLRRILWEYGCELVPTVASKINITRKITKQRFIPILEKQKILCTQVPNYQDGQDVAQNTIKKIRKDLHLDDQNGIDSRAFYSKGPMKATDFIAYYRKTLGRLAKF